MLPPMMPVNLSMSGLAALAGASLEDTRPAEGTIPQNAGELTNTEQESYELHGDVAAKLGFPVFSINIADRYTVVAFVVSRFVDHIPYWAESRRGHNWRCTDIVVIYPVSSPFGSHSTSTPTPDT